MTQEVRLWKIDQGHLQEIDKPKLDLEERLEDWIASDITIIASNLLVIGRQIETEFGGVIDILCLDENGDTVIIELKRDKTPREITAQVLDYASWVKDLTPDQIQDIAENYFKDRILEEVYQDYFHREMPDSINEEHRMLVVGSEIDSSSRRIINYLFENYGIAINAITFNYFKHENEEYLARTFLIEQSKIQNTLRLKSKRRQNLTNEQLQDIATEKGVGEVYQFLFEELPKFFDGMRTTRSSLSFVGRFRETRRAAIFNFIPKDSDSERGLNWQVYDLRFREFFDISEEKALSILPPIRTPWKYGTAGDQTAYREAEVSELWQGYSGYFRMDDAKNFVQALSNLST